MQKTSFFKSTLTFFCLMILVTACSTASPTSVQPDVTELAELVARTQTAIAVVEIATQAAGPVDVTSTPTPTQSIEILPSATPTLEPTVTDTVTPTPQPADCTDKMKFVEETIPDKTSFSANKSFTKTWTVQNVGTCTWTPDYYLIYVDGEQMGAAIASPLGQTVPPQSTTVLSINLVAPATSGVYKGNWMMRNPRNQLFGLGTNADKPFWVEINVVQTSSELNLGNPTWNDGFDSDSGFWVLGNDSKLGYKLTNSTLVMTGFEIAGDLWRLNSKPEVKNLFLETNFITGDKCSGKDSYGLIVRSTDSNDDIFDSGYVFTFSCDGMYRLYRMDDGTYAGLLNWTSSTEIKAGSNVSNRMGIYIEDDLIQLYANGNRLAQIRDTAHEDGKWGLVLRANETSNLEIIVEDVSYWILGD
jgi:hypothetical protein